MAGFFKINVTMEKEQNGFSFLEASFEEIRNSDLTFKNTNIPWYTDIEDAGVNPSLSDDIHSGNLLDFKFPNRLNEGFLSSIKSNPIGIFSDSDSVNTLVLSVKSLDKYEDTSYNLYSENIEEGLFDEGFTFQSAFLEDPRTFECAYFVDSIFHQKEEGWVFNSELTELDGRLIIDSNDSEVDFLNVNWFDGDQSIGEGFSFEHGIDQKETGIGNIGEFISDNGILNTESILAHINFDADIEIIQSNLGIENKYSFDAFHSYSNVNEFLVGEHVDTLPNLINNSIEEESIKKNRNLDLGFSAIETDPKYALISEKSDYCRRFIEELTKVDKSLVEIYKGVIEINSLKPADYKRHVANGLRELISNTIRFLLPDDNNLKSWLIKTNRKQLLYEKNGKLVPSRKAKLTYLFRDRPKRERKLAEKEADCINRLYHILNKPTHNPRANIPGKLMMNYLEKVKNHLRTLILLYNHSR